MTTPVCTSCGTVHMDSCPGLLQLCISPGFLFEGRVALHTKLGALADWPAGTQTRLRFSWGTGTELIIAGTVDGPYLEFAMTPDETEQLPRGTVATVDLNYDAGDPDRWRPWRTGRIGC